MVARVVAKAKQSTSEDSWLIGRSACQVCCVVTGLGFCAC